MTNPEHSLWMNFIVLACQARGLVAHTKSEALQELNRGRGKDDAIKQGFLTITRNNRKFLLRPDALAYEADGITWFEIDRSKRGADREASLVALARRIGSGLVTGNVLRCVVVHAKTDRIFKRALALFRAQVKASLEYPLTSRNCAFLEIEEGIFEVRALCEQRHQDNRVSLIEKRVGHAIVQLIPTWLPKVRLDARNTQPLSGWFGENYLPYRRPIALGPWSTAISPLRETVPEVVS